MWLTKWLLVPIDFHSRKYTIEVTGDHAAIVWLDTFFQITFIFNRRKTFIWV